MSDGLIKQQDYVELSWDEFVEKFDLVPSPDGEDMWDTHKYWDELKERAKENRVWTYTEVDNGTVICEGLHFVNRLGYYVTVRPYDPTVAYDVDYQEDEQEEMENE